MGISHLLLYHELGRQTTLACAGKGQMERQTAVTLLLITPIFEKENGQNEPVVPARR